MTNLVWCCCVLDIPEDEADELILDTDLECLVVGEEKYVIGLETVPRQVDGNGSRFPCQLRWQGP